MSATHCRIVAQLEDPELRRHREEILAKLPWLRSLELVLGVGVTLAVAVSIALYVFG